MNTHQIHRIDVHSHYSQSVSYNGVVYLSGQVSWNGGDITEQCREVFRHVDEQLARAGSARDRILSMQIFLRNSADYAAMNAVWDEWMPVGAAPARNTICGVQFPNPAWLVEVVVTAAV